MMFRSLAASASAFAPHQTQTQTQQRSMNSQALFAATLAPPPLSPLTSWGDRISDIRQAQQQLKDMDLPEHGLTVSSKDLGIAADDTEAQLKYIQEHAMELKQKMQDHGAVIFRDFDLMKSQPGFQEFYKALGMKVCLDPLHSVSARPTVDGQKNSPVYEAVNKESRKNFFIGTYKMYMCFVILYRSLVDADLYGSTLYGSI
jgi:hypothetical protein